MIPKKNRVNKKTIDLIFKEGKFINSPLLAFKYIKEKENKNFNIPFIVPKTVSKKAVDRNLLKRRGYFVIKNNALKIKKEIVGVFIFNKKAVPNFLGRKNKKYNPILNLEKEINSILNKI